MKKKGFLSVESVSGSTYSYSNVDSYLRAFNHRYLPGKVAYGRYGSEIAKCFESEIAKMEHGYASMTTCSGLSAITTSIFSQIKSNDHILVVKSVFGPTKNFCNKVLAVQDVDVSYYDPCVVDDFENSIKENTKLIFMESPGSLTYEIQEIDNIVKVAKENNITTIMDSTWATPVNFQPLKLGVNISIHSVSKYIGGHSDLLLGVITTDEDTWSSVRETQLILGNCGGEQEIRRALRGLKTLKTRLAQHFKSALLMANWLEKQSYIKRVFFPALEESKDFELWQKYFKSGNGLITIEFEEGYRDFSKALVNQLEYFSIGSGWGGCDSLIMPIQKAELTTERHESISGPLYRISVGLEPIKLLLEDIEKNAYEINTFG